MTTITFKHWHQDQPASLQETASNIWKQLMFWHDRSRQRQQLAAMSSAQLLDIGISRTAAQEESMKSFWRS